MPNSCHYKMSYKLATVAWREAHFITGIALVEKVCFPEHKIKEGFQQSFNAPDFFANGEVKLVEPILEHYSKKFKNFNNPN